MRPEAAHLVVEGAPERNVLPGTVVFVRDLGELFECFVDCGMDEPVIVARIAPGLGARAAGRSGGRALPRRCLRGRGVVSERERPSAGTYGVLAFPVAMLVIFFLIPFGIMVATSFYHRIEGAFYEPAFELANWQRLFQPVFLERALFSIGSACSPDSCASSSRSRSRTS